MWRLNLHVFCILFSVFVGVKLYMLDNASCGVDNSKASAVYEGVADIKTYPWLGTLLYPMGKKKIIVSVVLVTKQMVIGSAFEFDKLPKENVRLRSRVVLGQSCSGPTIPVRDYSFHPDYNRNTYSALVLVQLDVDQIHQELRPICPLPNHFSKPDFFAMTSLNDCKKGKLRIYKMRYVNPERCKQFYRKAELDMDAFWPSHTACARAASSGRCMWRSGTVLVVKHHGKWRLLGFGMYGPGCQSPARFLDYGMHQLWVRSSVARVGLPAITRISGNHLLMRRSLSNVQRFGPCDPEEMKYEIYTDRITIVGESITSKASYNVSLYSDVEYSCIILRAETGLDSSEGNAADQTRRDNPKLFLRRWCAGPPQVCYGFQYTDIHFYVEIHFTFETTFSIAAYGQTAQILDPLKAMEYANKLTKKLLVMPYKYLMVLLSRAKSNKDHYWFYKDDVKG